MKNLLTTLLILIASFAFCESVYLTVNSTNVTDYYPSNFLSGNNLISTNDITYVKTTQTNIYENDTAQFFDEVYKMVSYNIVITTNISSVVTNFGAITLNGTAGATSWRRLTGLNGGDNTIYSISHNGTKYYLSSNNYTYSTSTILTNTFNVSTNGLGVWNTGDIYQYWVESDSTTNEMTFASTGENTFTNSVVPPEFCIMYGTTTHNQNGAVVSVLSNDTATILTSTGSITTNFSYIYTTNVNYEAVLGTSDLPSNLAKTDEENTFAEKQDFTKGLNALGGTSIDSSIAMGVNSVATGTNSVASGNSAVAQGEGSTAIGSGATSLAKESTALGTGAVAEDEGEIQIGSPVVTTHIDLDSMAGAINLNGDVTLTKLTANGFVKTSAGDGTLIVDTETYLPTIDGTASNLTLTGSVGLDASSIGYTPTSPDTSTTVQDALDVRVASPYNTTNSIYYIWQGSATQFGNLATTNATTQYLIWE